MNGLKSIDNIAIASLKYTLANGGGDHAGLVHTFFYLFYNPKYLRILF